MIYTARQGPSQLLWERFIPHLGMTMPLIALSFLGVALLSVSSYTSIGRQPQISAPGSFELSTSAEPSPPGQASDSTPAPTPPPPTTEAAVPAPTIGGRGGGSVSTTPVNQAVASSDAVASSNPAQTTVTIPPINLQADDKVLLSAPGTSITIN